MRRKKFLKAFAGAAIGTTALSSCYRPSRKGKALVGENASFDTQYNWNMVTTWPPNFPILGEACSQFAQWVETMSSGRIKIHVYGGGELIPALEVFDAVSSGTAVLGHGAPYYWAGKVPAAQFMCTVPFGMNALQQIGWIESGGGMELWRELYAQYNIVPFLAGNTNAQMGGWFNREIKSKDDFKGLKMRIPGLGGKIFKKMGGTPVLSPGGEIYTNLERGIIDATEWIGPYHDAFMGFDEIAKYYYAPGWQEMGATLELMINKNVYDSISPDLKMIIEAAASKLNIVVMAMMDDLNSSALIKMKQKGIDIRVFPDDVLQELKENTKLAIDEIISTDSASKKIYESYISYMERTVAYQELTEMVVRKANAL